MSAALLIADALVLAGVAVLTLAVWGVMRLPDTFARLHSASKAAALGVGLLLLSSLTSGQPDMVVRALVVLGFLSVTAPVGSHAVARLERACRAGETQTPPAPARGLPWTRKSPREAAGSSRAVRRGTRPKRRGRGEDGRS